MQQRKRMQQHRLREEEDAAVVEAEEQQGRTLKARFCLVKKIPLRLLSQDLSSVLRQARP
jgi:hypothetical protein